MPISARLPALMLLSLVVGCAAPAATPSTPAPTCPATGTPGAPATAVVSDANGDDVPGLLGSYVYCGRSSDSAWPAADDLLAVALPADEINVVVSLDDGPPFVGWQAEYADPSATAAQVTLAQGTTNGSESVSFAGPPRGEWVLAVTLVYAGDIGRATWYWLAAAP